MSDRPDPAWLALLAPLGGAVALALSRRHAPGALAHRELVPFGVTAVGLGALLAAGLSGVWSGGVAIAVGAVSGVAAQMLSVVLARGVPRTGGGVLDQATDAGGRMALAAIGVSTFAAGCAVLAGQAISGPAGAAAGGSAFALAAVLVAVLCPAVNPVDGRARSALAAHATAVAAAVTAAVLASDDGLLLVQDGGDPRGRAVAFVLGLAGLGAIGGALGRLGVRTSGPGQTTRALLRWPILAAVVVALGGRGLEEALGLVVLSPVRDVTPSGTVPVVGGLALALLAVGSAPWAPGNDGDRGLLLVRIAQGLRSPAPFFAVALACCAGSVASAGALGLALLAVSVASLAAAALGVGETGAVLAALTAPDAEVSASAGPARVAGERHVATLSLLAAAAAAVAVAPGLLLALLEQRTPDPASVSGLSVGLALGGLLVGSTRFESLRHAPLALGALAAGIALALGGPPALGAVALPALVVVALGLASGACVRARPQALATVQALALVAVLAATPVAPGATRPRAPEVEPAPVTSRPAMRAADDAHEGGR